jgi:serine/threonine protein kinase/Leucine-rich repeat (LRR) protein
MAEGKTCPSRDDLQRLLLGQLGHAEAARLEMHLDGCPNCLSVLRQSIASDELLEAVRARRGEGSEPTATIAPAIGQREIRGGISTWIAARDTTSPEHNPLRTSAADVKSLLSPPQFPDEIGRIADFRVLRLLCLGGMGAVFEAEDIGLKRRVALKLMHASVAATPGATARFLREAQSAAALKHEHVVTIYQVGMHGAMPFIALELLDGETLENRLVRNGNLSVQDVIRIGREIAMGLTAAHRQGLLHRDIKPANIWLEEPQAPSSAMPAPVDGYSFGAAAANVKNTDFSPGRLSAGRVKILDFGLARQWATDSGMSQQGVVTGTPGYLAPEQFLGSAVDPRSDLFSLGCLMYRMASGKLPFGGSNLLSMVRALAVEEPPPVRTLNPQVPQPLSDLIGQLISKSPDERPPSAQAVVDRLRAIERQIADGTAIEKPAAHSAANPVKPVGQRKKWIARTTIGFLVLMSLGSLIVGEIPQKLAKFLARPTAAQPKPLESASAGAVAKDLAPRVATPLNLERRAAQWVLSVGGSVTIHVADQSTAIQVHPNDTLPVAFELTDVNLRHCAVTADGLEHLEQLKHLKTLVLTNTSVTDDCLARLQGLTELESLSLDGTQVTDFGLAKLETLKNLRILLLNRTQVTDAGLVHLESLSKLEALYLREMQVTDAGLAHLNGLAKLQFLALTSLPVTDAGLAQIKGLKQLMYLSLESTRVTDAGLVHLQGLKHLNRLVLDHTRVTDAGLAHLQSLTTLQNLYLGGTRVTDNGLEHLLGLTKLDTLSLNCTRVTGAGLIGLQALPALHVLHLMGNTQVGDAGLPAILHLQHLRDIDLSNTHVSAKGFAALKTALSNRTHVVWSDANYTAANAVLAAGGSVDIRTDGATADRSIKAVTELPPEYFQVTSARLCKVHGSLEGVFAALKDPALDALISLDLSGTAISDADIRHLKGLTHLRRLTLDGTPIRGAGLESLAGLTHLVELVLSGTQITGTGLEHLRDLRELQTLVLTNTPLTDAGLAHLKGLAKLESLSLDGTRVTDSGLVHLLALKNLHALILNWTRVTEVGLVQLQSLPRLEILNLRGTHVTEAGVAHLARLTKLQNLNVSWLPVTDTGLGQLTDLKQLTVLNLDMTQVTDRGLSQLQTLKNLQHLVLDHTGVTEAGLAHLQGLAKLETLSLNGTQVTGIELIRLQTLKYLHVLHLKDVMEVRDAAIPTILQLQTLRDIDLSNTHVSANGFSRLKAGLPHAHLAWSEPNYVAAQVVLAAGGSVDIRTDEAATDRSIKAPGELPAKYFRVTGASLRGVRRSLDVVFATLSNRGVGPLVSLDLSGSAISDADLERLKGLTHLHRLILDDATLSGAGLMHLQQLPELVELRLGCPKLTELFLWELGGLKKLERLSLAQSSASDEGTKYLTNLTHLKELDLRKTKVTATRVRELRKTLGACRILTTAAAP